MSSLILSFATAFWVMPGENGKSSAAGVRVSVVWDSENYANRASAQ